MAYRSEVTSGLPQDGVVLGWFVFQLPTVTDDTTTTIQLASFEDGDTTFDNTVSVLESGSVVRRAGQPARRAVDGRDLVARAGRSRG